MNKALIVIGMLALVVLAGCSGTTVTKQETTPTSGNAVADAPVQEATNNIVDNSNGVQIGEMV